MREVSDISKDFTEVRVQVWNQVWKAINNNN